MTVSSPFPFICRLLCISANCSGCSSWHPASYAWSWSSPKDCEVGHRDYLEQWFILESKNHSDLHFMHLARFRNSWRKGNTQKILSESLLWAEWVQKEEFLKIKWTFLASGEGSDFWHLVQYCGKKRLQGSPVLHCPREVRVSRDAD